MSGKQKFGTTDTFYWEGTNIGGTFSAFLVRMMNLRVKEVVYKLSVIQTTRNIYLRMMWKTFLGVFKKKASARVFLKKSCKPKPLKFTTKGVGYTFLELITVERSSVMSFRKIREYTKWNFHEMSKTYVILIKSWTYKIPLHSKFFQNILGF